jgi:hypothetical protein
MLTIEKLFSDVNIVKAIIDRVQALKLDVIFWQRYLTFEETRSRVFKNYLGTVTGVTAGSVIGKNANKPLRERKSLGSGYGEVAFLGDRYQMDNDRLDTLKALTDKYNTAGTAGQQAAMTAVIDYIVDDYRQVLLAPHKRMDIVLGDLRSDGKASVKNADNPNGVELLDIELPVKRLTPAVSDKPKFISYLKEQVESLKTTLGLFSVVEMSRKTFNQCIVASQEFGDFYKMIFTGREVNVSTGLITSEMATQVFTGIGLPPIRIIEDYVAKPDGTIAQAFKDNRVAFLPGDNLGRMMWHQPYEASDPIPGKSYTNLAGGQWISNVRTEEGRFMEYGAEWIPNITAPNKIVIVDLDTMNP